MLTLASLSLILSGLSTLVNGRAISTVGDRRRPPRQVSYSLDGSFVTLPEVNADPSTAPFSWWYLDLVGDDPVYTAQVVFYAGYPFGQIFDTPYYVQLIATLQTVGFNAWAPITDKGSVAFTDAIGSDGDWGLGGQWVSDADGTRYVATFNTSVSSGTITLDGLEDVPAHYPCDSTSKPTFDPAVTNNNLLSPNLGWTNVIPGARGQIELTYQVNKGCSGQAYHDQNFGLQPLENTVNQWVWGRAVLGKYTLVFLSNKEKGSGITSTDPSDWELSGYLTYGNSNNRINFCTAKQTSAQKALQNLKIETWGDIWSATPAQTGTPLVFTDAQNGEVGMNLTFVSGNKTYKFTISSALTVLSGNWVPYARFSGHASGGEIGGEQATGTAMFEYINYGE
ncbi:hypothetical protein BT69DRAFT_1336294 [Atractiella rhizophila]|nr:hypothetical protein BT69DRAFT_1336294 [Atractiella rhizophila]